MEEQENTSSRKILIGILIVVAILLIIGGILFFLKGKSGEKGISSVTSLFGTLGQGTVEGGKNIQPGTGVDNGTGDQGTGQGEEPLFRELADFPVAGATLVIRDGQTFVRFIAKENGYIYDADPRTGERTQITNTTIPRVSEAYWGANGDIVIIRYLARDPISQQEAIKTYIGNVVAPYASSSDAMGSISGDFLPDNISEVSVSPDGTHLFYILPVSDGVTGTLVDLRTDGARVVFQSPFSEWLPQLLNSGKIILTTKPSADVPGFAYVYDPGTQSLSRLLREKNGLTTLSDLDGGRVLFSENISNNTSLGVYSANGFGTDEGGKTDTVSTALSTLPEKCAWGYDHIRIFCGAFNSVRASIPDEWYQGEVSLSDTFWTESTDAFDLMMLADPDHEIKRSFDVTAPFIDVGDAHFFFIDKNDDSLWSMRIDRTKYTTEDVPPPTPVLTPEEMKDAAGSMNAAASTTGSSTNY